MGSGGRVRRLSEQLLLQSGVRALNTRALDGLRRMLAPDALEAASRGAERPKVSKHSAYRLWPDRDQAVVDVAQHVLDPVRLARKGLDSALEAYENAIEDHTRCRQPVAGSRADEFRGLFQQVMAANFSVQLGSEERLAAWLLQLAATSCSPLWDVSPGPDGADYELGRQILEARIRFNEAAIAEWAVILRGAMVLFGRRPRPGYTVRDIVQLMYCMFDGSFLRLFVDPDVVILGPRPAVREPALQRAVARACDVMYEIAWSCSEPGLLADPRRPDDPDDPRAQAFDVLVEQAEVVYCGMEPGEHVDLRVLASDAGEDVGMARFLFPEAGDLPDSVLRWLVRKHAKPAGWGVSDATPWIVSTLRVLSDVASSHPAVVAAVVHHQLPADGSYTPGFVGELIQAVGGLMQASRNFHSDEPGDEARHLVTLALEGESGWWGAKAVLDRAAARAGEG